MKVGFSLSVTLKLLSIFKIGAASYYSSSVILKAGCFFYLLRGSLELHSRWHLMPVECNDEGTKLVVTVFYRPRCKFFLLTSAVVRPPIQCGNLCEKVRIRDRSSVAKQREWNKYCSFISNAFLSKMPSTVHFTAHLDHCHSFASVDNRMGSLSTCATFTTTMSS